MDTDVILQILSYIKLLVGIGSMTSGGWIAMGVVFLLAVGGYFWITISLKKSAARKAKQESERQANEDQGNNAGENGRIEDGWDSGQSKVDDVRAANPDTEKQERPKE